MISKFTNERNYGCRYQEISIYGYKSLVLENDLLRITILIGRGCEIVEFNYKKEDIDLVWRTPKGLKALKYFSRDYSDDNTLADHYIGGWFDAFPSLNPKDKYINTELPIYGEVCYLPWEYEVIEDSPEEVTIKVFCNTIRSPFYFEKTFRLKGSDSTLYTETCIENISRQKAYFNLAYHPNFGKAFIDNEVEMNLKGCDVEIKHDDKKSRFKAGSKGRWPILKSKEGSDIDLRKIPEPFSGISEVIFLNNMEEGMVLLKNKDKEINLEITWDHKLLRHVLLWNVRHGDDGYPWYGNANVLCIMPRTSIYENPADLIENGDLVYIDPKEIKETWMNFKIEDTNI